MTIEVEKNGHVWTVIMNRPETRNAMDPESADALTRAMLDFDADSDARVAVLYGDGGAFCAGWDLKYVSTLDSRLSARRARHPHRARPGQRREIPRGPLGPTRLELDKPVIAAVAGPAVAGGMELALWCDFRVMQEDAYFGVYCRRWGVPLIDGGTVRLPRIVGQGRALEIILTGRKVPAEECLPIGLCEYLVANGEVRAKAEALAQDIAAFPPGVRPRGPAFGDQERGPAGARRDDPGVVQRPRSAGEGRRRRRRALQGRSRPPRRFREDLLSLQTPSRRGDDAHRIDPEEPA